MKYKGETYDVSSCHPATATLPWGVDSDDFADIVADMTANGFDPQYPIVTDKKTGLLIAGRKRELAAMIADVVPKYRALEFPDEQSIINFVRREELNRRHLTASQRAMSIVELNKLAGDKTLDELAESAHVSKRTVSDAVAVSESPELVEEVREGRMSVSEAAKEVKQSTAKPKPVVVEGYPLNPVFMPNAMEAASIAPVLEEVAEGLGQVIELLDGLELTAKHVIYKRIDFAQTRKDLVEIKTLISGNLPTSTCPNCIGTTKDHELPCKYCAGYGITDKDSANNLESKWEVNKSRYEELSDAK